MRRSTPSSTPVGSDLRTARLHLEPLAVSHAAEAARAFADARLHPFTGGAPADEEALRDRYTRQVAGHSPDGTQTWLNWMLRRPDTAELVGTVQATVSGETAELAWVVAVPHQGHGFAVEAAQAMAGWLRGSGVRRFVAHIHPDHAASAGVAPPPRPASTPPAPGGGGGGGGG